MTGATGPSILVVDDDEDVGDVVAAILSDEGYSVTTVSDLSGEAFRTALGKLEPDLILLDGAGRHAYGEGWLQAARVHLRDRPVPIIMLTAHAQDAREARSGASPRAESAAFAAVLLKPFSLETLLDVVSKSVSHTPFNRSDAAEHVRTDSLVAELRAIGATDILPSARRQWATFRLPPDDRVYQLYWWQRQGQYLLGAYSGDGVFEKLGTFWELAEALAACQTRVNGLGPAAQDR